MINNIFINTPILGNSNQSLTNLGLYALITMYLVLDVQAIGQVWAENHCDLLSLSSLGFIPWHNTHSLSKGAQALNRMYDSLSQGDPLKVFLTKHCLHLLKPLQGHTGIPTNLVNPVELQKLPNTVRLMPKFTPSQMADLPGTVGIYVLYLASAVLVTQCGSSVSFLNRMSGHYRSAAKKEFIFKDNDIQDFTWTPVMYSPSYTGQCHDP
jgi:hypothetical protein